MRCITSVATPAKAMRLSVCASSGKIKDKEKGASSECIFSLLLIVFDKVGNRRTEPSRGPRSLAGQLKTRTIWYNGGHKETRGQRFDLLNVLNLYFNYIRPKGYLTSGTDELKDKQGKIKKKVKMVA